MKKNFGGQLAKLTSNVSKRVDEFVSSRIDSSSKPNADCANNEHYMPAQYGHPSGAYGGYAQAPLQYAYPPPPPPPGQPQYVPQQQPQGGVPPPQYVQQPQTPQAQYVQQPQGAPYSPFTPPNAAVPHPNVPQAPHAVHPGAPHAPSAPQAPSALPQAPHAPCPNAPQAPSAPPHAPHPNAPQAPSAAKPQPFVTTPVSGPKMPQRQPQPMVPPQNYPHSESSSNGFSGQAGYADAAVLVGGNGRPMFPPQADGRRPSPPPMVPQHMQDTSRPQYAPAQRPPAHAPEARNQDLQKISPPPNGMAATPNEKVDYIMRISTVSTCAVCGDFNVQPWFCRMYPTEGGGGVSEEYHSDEASLLRANFLSIGLPVGSARDLIDLFTERNSVRFESYSCNIRTYGASGPAVLIEHFGRWLQMVDIYFEQSMRYAGNVVELSRSRSTNQPLDEPPITSLKFPLAAASDGAFSRVVDSARDAKRAERSSF